MAVTKKKTTKKKALKIVCPECGGKLFLNRDAILSYPLKGNKVEKPLLKRKDIAELDNNWLECRGCSRTSHHSDGNIGCESLKEIYDKLKW